MITQKRTVSNRLLTPYSVNNIIRILIFKFRQISIALIITGGALGMYLNFFMGNYGWNNILMMFSIIFLPNWNKLLSLKLPFYNINYIILFLFQLLCLFCLSICVLPADLSKSQLYIFHLFIIGVLISFMSLRQKDIDFKSIINYSWGFTSICSLCCFICCITGIYAIEYAHTHSGTGYNSILSPLTMSGACSTNIICCLFLHPRKKWLNIIKFIIFFVSIASLFMVDKRTPLVITILILVAYFWRASKFNLKIRKSYIVYTIIFIAILLLLLSNPIINEAVLNLFTHTIDGIKDMLFGTSKSGDAAVARFEARQWAFNFIDNEFSFINYILGYGYMTRWLDIPLLQSFLDLGIIGFVIYLCYVVLYPIVILFSKYSRNPFVLFVCFLNFHTVFSSLNSGHPYYHTKWWPVIFLIFVVQMQKTTLKSNK